MVSGGKGSLGRPEFLWVGNHPGLDFCNTAPVVGEAVVELLAQAADLEAWLVLAGAPGRDGGGVTRVETVAWARRLRAALRALLEGEGVGAQGGVSGPGGGDDGPGGPDRDGDGADRDEGRLRRLNELLAEVSAVPAVGEGGRLCLWPAPAQGGAIGTDNAGAENHRRLELVQLVVPAAGLDRARVRRCANPACVLLFYDTSKGGRRRWHDMATCGNRAKAASHYARVRGLPV